MIPGCSQTSLKRRETHWHLRKALPFSTSLTSFPTLQGLPQRPRIWFLASLPVTTPNLLTDLLFLFSASGTIKQSTEFLKVRPTQWSFSISLTEATNFLTGSTGSFRYHQALLDKLQCQVPVSLHTVLHSQGFRGQWGGREHTELTMLIDCSKSETQEACVRMHMHKQQAHRGMDQNGSLILGRFKKGRLFAWCL